MDSENGNKEDSNSFPLVTENEEATLLDRNEQDRRKKLIKCWVITWSHTKANMLLILTIVSVVLGLILGISIRPANPSPLVQELVSFPGEIFLRALKMLILPLIVFSLIAGLGSLDIKVAGALGIRTIVYYGTTTTLAVVLGLMLVMSIRPGNVNIPPKPCDNHTLTSTQEIETLDSILDLVRNLVPDNLFTATYSQTHTEYYSVADWSKCAQFLGLNTSNLTCSEIQEDLSQMGLIGDCPVVRHKSTVSRSGMNILGIIAFTIGFSISLSYLGEVGHQVVRTISVLNEAIMKLVIAVMWTSPVGIASIIAGKLLEVDSLSHLVQELGLYMVCVMLGLLIHACLTLPVLYLILTRKNPLKLVRGALQALLIAFGTSSSSATLPVTMRCLEENLGYDARVTRFMLPVGATINMDGTALYEAIAAVFIAQVEGVATGPAKIIVIALTATLASIGAAGVPQAGLVTLIIVLTAIGLPAENAAIILAVDWLLDRFRTVVNVYGDCIGVGIVAHLSRKQLMDPPLNTLSSSEEDRDSSPHHYYHITGDKATVDEKEESGGSSSPKGSTTYNTESMM